MYDELVKRLRDRAGAFDYDGRPDIACDYEQAADVRHVVLCKECKYRNTDKYGSWCLNDYENNLKDDDFCSRGKRKV